MEVKEDLSILLTWRKVRERRMKVDNCFGPLQKLKFYVTHKYIHPLEKVHMLKLWDSAEEQHPMQVSLYFCSFQVYHSHLVSAL